MANYGRVSVVQGQVRVRCPHAIVQRHAIFNHLEANLPSCAAFWRSDLGITLNAGDVSAQADQAARPAAATGIDVSQGTAANQPQYATAQRNNLPTVRFTGANGDVLFRSPSNPIAGGAYTLAGYWQDRSILSGSVYMAACAIGPIGAVWGVATTTRNVNHTAQHLDGAMQSTLPESWIVARGAGEAPTLLVDGIDKPLTNSGTTGLGDPGGSGIVSMAAFPTGAGPTFSGFSDTDFYQAALYTRKLSTAEQRLFGARMAAKYGTNWE